MERSFGRAAIGNEGLIWWASPSAEGRDVREDHAREVVASSRSRQCLSLVAEVASGSAATSPCRCAGLPPSAWVSDWAPLPNAPKRDTTAPPGAGLRSPHHGRVTSEPRCVSARSRDPRERPASPPLRDAGRRGRSAAQGRTARRPCACGPGSWTLSDSVRHRPLWPARLDGRQEWSEIVRLPSVRMCEEADIRIQRDGKLAHSSFVRQISPQKSRNTSTLAGGRRRDGRTA
jgi:hypothetical protein